MQAAGRPPLRGLLIDISGTLHVGSQPTSFAVSALRRLQRAGVPFRLCSNTSKESTSHVSQRLRELGFETQDITRDNVAVNSGQSPREIWTSIGAIAGVMQDMGVRRPYALLSDSARSELHLNPLDEKEEENTPFDAVIVGLCPARLDYAHLNTAFRILAREHPTLSERQPVLIAAHRQPLPRRCFGRAVTRTWTIHRGDRTCSSRRESSCVVGKPTRAFFEAVIKDLDGHGCITGQRGSSVPQDGRVAIIGDDVESDLGGGACELGLWRVLVRTGKYRSGDDTRTAVPPDEVVDSFAAFVENLLSDLNVNGAAV
ncbi:Haloacid dehalogenase-like hydrolase domain-containing protein 2 [Favolaschia claudopus]|uniref:Haloacid dehalogenase-like hydrolase domain-containing protein 2 n=1 Tax=Favolaschia claudopus TaxID=2862362 RepID=A0AAW0D315_9AGAR